MLNEFIGDAIWVAAIFLVPAVAVIWMMGSIVPDDLQKGTDQPQDEPLSR